MSVRLIIALCLLAAAGIMYLCLQSVRRKHREDPRFEEEIRKRQEEYKRKTMKRNAQMQRMQEIIGEGYSDGGTEPREQTDDETEEIPSETDDPGNGPHTHFTVS